MAPNSKRRKTNSGVEEITFDTTARQDYLTGFRKRKQQRIKTAKEKAIIKGKEARIEMRKQLREQRKHQLEKHVAQVNAMMESIRDDVDVPVSDDIEQATSHIDATVLAEDGPGPTSNSQREEEYIDEDRYATVTIGAMGSSDEDEQETMKPIKSAVKTKPLKSRAKLRFTKRGTRMTKGRGKSLE